MPYSRPATHPEFCRTGSATEPGASKKDDGWLYTEKPPRQYFNWLHRLTYQWTQWLEQYTDFLNRFVTGSVNILEYGADSTGVASSDAALTAAMAASKNVVVPAGRYLLTATHTLADGATIAGVGLESKFDCQGTGAHFAFAGTGTIRDLTLLGDTGETGQIGIQLGGTPELKQNIVQNCFFNGLATAMRCMGAAVERESYISDCHIQYCTTGIKLESCDVTVDHSTLIGCTTPIYGYNFDHNVHAIISDSIIRGGTMKFELAKAISIVNCVLGIDVWLFDRSTGIDIFDAIMIYGYANTLGDATGQRQSFYRFLRCRDYAGNAVSVGTSATDALDAGYATITFSGDRVIATNENVIMTTTDSFPLTKVSGTQNNPNQTTFDFVDLTTGRVTALTGTRLVHVDVRLFINHGSASIDDIQIMLLSSSAVEWVVPIIRWSDGVAYCASGSFTILVAVNDYIKFQVHNLSGSNTWQINSASRIRIYNL